jgi:hypothetical protein
MATSPWSTLNTPLACACAAMADASATIPLRMASPTATDNFDYAQTAKSLSIFNIKYLFMIMW